MAPEGSRSTPTPTPASSVVGRTPREDSPKIPIPEIYHGDRNKLDDWLMELEIYFRLDKKVDARNQVLFAATLMRGQAQKWIKPYLKKMISGGATAEERKWLTEFDEFKDHIETVFGASNEKNKAIRIIQHLRQKRSAAEYTQEFQQYATVTGWEDAALMVMYRRGLKNSLRVELNRSGATIESMEDLIEEAIRIDDSMYELEMEFKHDKGGNRGYGGGFPRHPRKTTKDPYGYAPMELDIATKGRFQKKGGRQQKNKGKTNSKDCYACGKPGHFARDCRQKNKVQRQSLSMMTKGKSKEGPPLSKLTPFLLRSKIDELKAEESHLQAILKNYRKNSPTWNDCKRAIDSRTQERREWEIEAKLEDEIPEWEDLTLNVLIDHRHQTNMAVNERINTLRRRDEERWVTLLNAGKRGREDITDTEEGETEEDEGNTSEEGSHESDEDLDDDRRYAFDQRNLQHERIGIWNCYYKDCDIHNHPRGEGDRGGPDCAKNWTSCHDRCRWHLWDKRDHGFFPEGPTDEDKNPCHCDRWIHCLDKYCLIHRKDKETYGFADTTEYDEMETLLGTINESEDDSPTIHEPAATLHQVKTKYNLDPRNLKHEQLADELCVDEECAWHQHVRGAQPEPGCMRNWNECKRDSCEWHLWDKRGKLHFSGHNNYFQSRLLKMQEDLNECQWHDWKYCLERLCRVHEREKVDYGFLSKLSEN